jgi:hypothetical protein
MERKPQTWEERQAEKQRSREQDAADLAAGRTTRDELRRKNSFLSPETIRRSKVNYRGAKSVL